MPFLVLPYSVAFMEGTLTKMLFTISSASCILIIISGMIQALAGLKINPLYPLVAPLAGVIIAFGFLAGIIKARRKKGVQWSGRDYVYSVYSSKGFKL